MAPSSLRSHARTSGWRPATSMHMSKVHGQESFSLRSHLSTPGGGFFRR